MAEDGPAVGFDGDTLAGPEPHLDTGVRPQRPQQRRQQRHRHPHGAGGARAVEE